ncbi:MAG: FecR domain-containing protein [Bacteroidota bacterium]
MPQYDIKDLLEKHKDGTILPEEQAFLETWYLNWRPETKAVSSQEVRRSKAKVWGALENQQINTTLWLKLSGVAAVFLIIAVYWIARPDDAGSLKNPVNAQVNADSKPASSKAILTLASGEEVILENSSTAKPVQQGNVTIRQAAGGKLVYDPSESGTETTAMINKISTPRGGQYQLVLSDGTKVWLNAASSISFPVAFLGNKREVSVTGEAYFEVAHNKSRPFVVSAEDQEITVLGTHFNVSAYNDDDFTSTALISGLINVKSKKSGIAKVVHPGQAALSSLEDPLSVEKVNTDDVLSWKNGYFQFDNQSIYSIMKIMTRWYDVDVEYRGGASNERFGGTFSRGKNLSESLSNLEKLGKVHFKILPKKVIVTN